MFLVGIVSKTLSVTPSEPTDKAFREARVVAVEPLANRVALGQIVL